MAVAFQVQPFRFSGAGDGKPATDTLTFPFPSTVKEAACAVGGFRFDFADQGADVPSLDIVELKTRVSQRSGSTVVVQVSAHFDVKERNASFNGNVDVLVIAEL